MVGISGKSDRAIHLENDEYGNEVVVFGNWENWKKYYEIYRSIHEIIDPHVWLDEFNIRLYPEFQWQWKQNYPDLVADDLSKIFGDKDDLWSSDNVRNIVYADLLYRGINKWLFVRYILIRYKKLVATWRNTAWNRYSRWKRLYNMAYPERFRISVNEWGKLNYMSGYWKGYYDAMHRVRADLKTMCNTPRYIVWNGSKPGFVVDKKISRGWLQLVGLLWNIRFKT